VEARDSGHFDVEIVPVTVPAHTEVDQEGNEVEVPETVVSRDDGPRPGTTMEVLGKLKPAFKPDGTVTAGNACPLNDGAAAVLVMSDEKAERIGVKPLARIVASTVVAIRPEIMGLGPIPAIRALLEQTGMTMDDIDVVEINEAFAAQIVPCKDELGIPDEKLNPFGGAIALGHPFDDRRAHHDDAHQRLALRQRSLRHRVDVRGRRDGPGDADRVAVARGLGVGRFVRRAPA
jgi:acetyl-CoA C-acetyltransferase